MVALFIYGIRSFRRKIPSFVQAGVQGRGGGLNFVDGGMGGMRDILLRYVRGKEREEMHGEGWNENM